MGITKKFVKHVLPGVIKPARVLWNEIIGFLFVVLAVFIGFSSYRRARAFNGDTGEMLLLVAYFLFTALLLYYGLSSFLKARKISRS